MKKIKKRFVAWTLVLALLGGYKNAALAAEIDTAATVSGSELMPTAEEGGAVNETENTEEAEAASANTQEETDTGTADMQGTDTGTADTQETDTVSANTAEVDSARTSEEDMVSANSLMMDTVSADYLTASSSYSYTPYWEGQGNFSNLIVFVDFSDTKHEHENSYGASCYLNEKGVEDTFRYFNGSDIYRRGMRQYLYNISYGQLKVENIFPQYDGESITPYTLPNTAAYYAQHEDEMVAQVIAKLNASGQLENSMNLDLEGGDGVLDNLTILVACEEGNKNTLFGGHKTTYGGADKVKGKLVRDYNLIHEMGVYFGLSNSGLIIHEFLHTIGYPDLYHRGTTSGNPVYVWDIMAAESHRIQYPLAYLRSAYTNWFTIDTVETSGTGFSLYAASETTAETKNQQALILKTDYSDSEFFVVEYRKKGTAYTEEYEQILPGSGLIIYRVNTSVQGGNIAGPPDMIYVFRPGDTYHENGYENGLGDIYASYLSSEVNRTSYGSSDFSVTLENGAITYSDGTNSGIVISNVGSASGDQITFDITFTEREEGDYWVTEAKENDTANTTDMASWQDLDQTFYHILTRGAGSSASAALYKQKGDIFTKMGNAPAGQFYQLVGYNGSLYAAYTNASHYVQLAKWTGSGWTSVYQTSVISYSGDFSLASDSQGVYLAYTDGTTVYALKTTGSGITKLGSTVGTASYVAGISLTAENGRVAILYRDFFSNNRVYIKFYDSASGSWSDAGSQSFSISSGKIKINNDRLYLLSNGTGASAQACLYVHELTNGGSGWTQVGPGPFTSVGIYVSDLCFVGSEPYIVYTHGSSPYCTQVSYLQDGEWTVRGDAVAKVNLAGLRIFSYGERLYVAYVNSVTGKAFVRTNLAMNADSLLEEETVSVGDKMGDDGVSAEKSLVISEEGRGEALTDAQLIRLLERQKEKGEFGTITLVRTGKDDRQLETGLSAEVFNAVLALLGDGGELELVFLNQTAGQEEVITWRLSGVRQTDSSLEFGVETGNKAGKLTLTPAGSTFPADSVRLTYSSDRLADAYGILLENSGQNSIPIYYYEDTAGGERLLKGEGEYQGLLQEGKYGETCRITIDELSQMAGKTTYTIETSRYDWRLEYGYRVTDEGNTAGTVLYYTTSDELYAALEDLSLAADINIEVEYKGKKKPEAIPQKLLQYCADYGCNLEFGYGEEGDKLWYRWRFTGLSASESLEAYPLDITILTAGAELSAEFTEKTYIQVLLDGQLPLCTEAELIVYGVEETKEFIGKGTIYQWNQTDTSPVLEKEAGMDGKEGGWFSLTLSRGTGAYLLTPQTSYGWIPVKVTAQTGEKTCMTYIEHQTGEKVTGWRTIEGRKCYFDQEGYLAEGPVRVGKYLYLFGKYAKGNPGILTGRQTIDDQEYYADSKGVLQLGWQKIDGIWHYFDLETGAEQNSQVRSDSWAVVTTGEGERCFYLVNKRTTAKGWRTIKGERYYFNEDGVLQTGFFTIGKNTFYGMKNDGVGEGLGKIAVGDQQIGTDTYYFGRNGVLLTGFQKLEGEWHFFSTAEESPERGRKQVINGPEIEGKWYWYTVNGHRYCLLRNKTVLTGWKTVNGNRYYFDSDTCAMQTGFITIGKNTYYLEEQEGGEKAAGVLLTGWIKPDASAEASYYANSSGVLLEGLQKVDGRWYYFDSVTRQKVKEIREEEIVDGFVTISGGHGEEKVFYLINNRTVAKGWRTINGIRYYFDTVTGERKTGLFQAGKHQYHYDENGVRKTGWWKDEEGNTYYFKEGRAVTGWQTVEEERYYFAGDGIMQTQLVTVGRGNYFLGSDGKMRTGFVRYCDNTYYFAANGKMLTGWQIIEGERYYFEENGYMYTGWLKRGNYTYYLDEQLSTYGRLVKGKREIDGFTYYFNERGILQSYVPLT